MGKSIALLGALPFPEIPARLRREGLEIEPSEAVAEWACEMFLTFGSKFYNVEHGHLAEMSIGFLLTNADYGRGGKTIIGEASLGEPSGKAWAVARQSAQIRGWFGKIPDFIITLSAPYLAQAEAGQICAVVEHELYHCSIRKDEMGLPKVDKYGQMTPTMRPHDIEEFVGVVARYGAVEGDHKRFKEALDSKPLFGPVDLRGICGTCR